MKALSLTQPWASLVGLGEKKYETRSWNTKYRGLIAIHASKGFPGSCKSLCYHDPFHSVLMKHLRANCGGEFYISDVIKTIATGSVIAVAELKATRGTDLIQSGIQISHQEYAFGDYSAGRFAWELADVIPLSEPIKCKGMLGLWNVPTDIEDQMLAQIRK